MRIIFHNIIFMYKRAKELFWQLEDAVKTLNEVVDLVLENKDPRFVKPLKDSVIQRFEYTVELSWKFLKYYLFEEYWEESSFPKEIFKKSYQVWLIKHLDIWFDMVDKRNRLSHDYHQEFANLSFEDIVDYIVDEFNDFIPVIKEKYV